MSVAASSATILSRTETPNNGRGWFMLSRAGGLHTIVWADKEGHELSAAVTGSGVLRDRRPLPACSFPGPAASGPDAPAQVMTFRAGGPTGASGTNCPAVLVW